MSANARVEHGFLYGLPVTPMRAGVRHDGQSVHRILENRIFTVTLESRIAQREALQSLTIRAVHANRVDPPTAQALEQPVMPVRPHLRPRQSI